MKQIIVCENKMTTVKIAKGAHQVKKKILKFHPKAKKILQHHKNNKNHKIQVQKNLQK